MKGAWIHYSPEELAWVEAHRALPRKELHRRFRDRFGRPDVSQANLTSLCKRRGWLTGRTGRFVKGQQAANKGKTMPYNPKSAATRFRPGHAPENRVPLWSERIGKGGYVEMKVPARNPYTGHETRFMHKHRWLWEQANGPVPEGHFLKCLDGDKTNCDPSNWRALPHALKPRLNGRFGRGYDLAPAEVKPSILLTALVEHAAREARKEREDGGGSGTETAS